MTIQPWNPNTVYWGTVDANGAPRVADEVEYEGGYWTAAYYNEDINPISWFGAQGSGAPWIETKAPVQAQVAPLAPTGLAAGYTSSSSVALFWNPAAVMGIGDVTSYDVYENGVKIGTTSGTTTSFTVSGLAASTTYNFSVDAVDLTGASPQDTPVAVTTKAPQAATGKYFSPFVDMTLPSTDLASIAEASGLRSFTLAFMQSAYADLNTTNGNLDPGVVPTLSWGGLSATTLPTGTIIQEVKEVEAEGGVVAISFGGYGGRDAAVTAEQYGAYLQTAPGGSLSAAAAQAKAVANLQAEYQSVINAYGVNSLDFDIESDALIVNGVAVPSTLNYTVDDTTANHLRDLALVALEQANPNLKISFTLATTQNGLDTQTHAQDGGGGDTYNVLVQAKQDGVRVDVVNLMAMDYGVTVSDMGSAAIGAANAAEAQLQGLGLTNTKIGITGMIGQNDTSGDVFTLANAQQLEAFAAETPWVAGLGMWELPRDNGSTYGASGVSPTGSNLNQTPYEFSQIFAQDTTAFHAKSDYNGDGKSDILFLNPNGALAMWEMNNTQVAGGGVFQTLSAGWTVGGIGDFNGDGNADIVLSTAAGALSLWDMNGTQVIGGGAIGSLGTGWSLGPVGDFNGDGKSDILFQNTNGALGMWEMNNTQVAGGGVFASLGANSGWSLAGTGDFNGDGKSDFALQNTNGQVALWEMNGTQVSGGGVIGTLSAGWSIAGIGDFNGDGKSDILLANTNGALSMWEMNGTQVIGGGQFQSLGANSGWSVAGVGDYNGDGMADILLHNTSGATQIWDMNGASVSGGGPTSSISAPWVIQHT